MFAIERYDIEPDLITVAKSIAAGLPLSGVVGQAEIMERPGRPRSAARRRQPGAQAAAQVVLDVSRTSSSSSART